MAGNSGNGRDRSSRWSGRLRSRSESEDNYQEVSSSVMDTTFSDLCETLFSSCDIPDSICSEVVLSSSGSPIRNRNRRTSQISSPAPTTRVTRSSSRMTPANAVDQKRLKEDSTKIFQSPANSNGPRNKTNAIQNEIPEKLRKIKQIPKLPRPFPQGMKLNLQLDHGQNEEMQEVSSSTNDASIDNRRNPEASTSSTTYKNKGWKNKGKETISKGAPGPVPTVPKTGTVRNLQNQKKSKFVESCAPTTPSRSRIPEMSKSKSARQTMNNTGSPSVSYVLPSMPDLSPSVLLTDDEIKIEPDSQPSDYHQQTWNGLSLPLSTLQPNNQLKHGSTSIGHRVLPLTSLKNHSSHRTDQQFPHADRVRDPERKRKAEQISQMLRNLLKLPKAHKWVCYEWFYSNIDQALFQGDNDFQICLRESFPNLKTNKLTRTELGFIRRLMGKPRRCSQRFFQEEREELEKRRQKVRMIQQRTWLPENWSFKTLPDEIPMLITIGSKVTARVRVPQDGIFSGTVAAVDTSNHTYRINFDRKEIGTHSIVDYEVLSEVPPETISLATLTMKIMRTVSKPSIHKYMYENLHEFERILHTLPASLLPVDAVLGGFPIRLLEIVVRLSKLVKAKLEKILALKELNVEAEKTKAYGKPYPHEFQLRYAKCVSDLASMNKCINKLLQVLLTCFTKTKGCEKHNIPSAKLLNPDEVLSNADKEANIIFSTYNRRTNKNGTSSPMIHNPKIVSLVKKITSLLMVARTLLLTDGGRKHHELKSLEESIQTMKASLRGSSLCVFENKIEIPLKRMMAGMIVDQDPNNPKPPKRPTYRRH